MCSRVFVPQIEALARVTVKQAPEVYFRLDILGVAISKQGGEDKTTAAKQDSATTMNKAQRKVGIICLLFTL